MMLEYLYFDLGLFGINGHRLSSLQDFLELVSWVFGSSFSGSSFSLLPSANCVLYWLVENYRLWIWMTGLLNKYLALEDKMKYWYNEKATESFFTERTEVACDWTNAPFGSIPKPWACTATKNTPFRTDSQLLWSEYLSRCLYPYLESEIKNKE